MKRILVVDDCRLTLAMARDILEGAGYQVCTTETCFEANRFMFSSPRPALLLIDVEMPLLRGDQAVSFFRERECCRDIPILFLSGKPEAELQQLVLKTGAEGYITKPIDASHLLAQVARYT